MSNIKFTPILRETRLEVNLPGKRIGPGKVTVDEPCEPDPDLVFETYTICKPLIAVMCVAEDKNEIDEQAKNVDYQNIIFTFNHMLGLGCVYQVMNDESDDEKSSDIDASDGFMHASKKMEHNKIKNLKFKTSWTSEDMLSFCGQVVETIENEKNGYDSLFFVLISCVKPNQRETDKEYLQISDSYGKLVNLSDIYKLFDKDNCECDSRKFPKAFTIDRYFDMTTKINDIMDVTDKTDVNFEAIKFNCTYENNFYCIEMEGKGQIIQLYSHRNALALVNSQQTGGFLSRAMKKVFIKKPKEPRSKIRNYLSFCVRYISQDLNLGASPCLRHPMYYDDVHFKLDIW